MSLDFIWKVEVYIEQTSSEIWSKLDFNTKLKHFLDTLANDFIGVMR